MSISAVIQIRGLIGSRKPVRDTFKMLRLDRKNHLILINENKDLMGMVNRIRDYVTWGSISNNVLKELIAKRGRLSGNKRVSDKDVDKFTKAILSGKWPSELKRVFRLSPPSKGFERLGIKFPYPRGALGPRGDKINELILRMI